MAQGDRDGAAVAVAALLAERADDARAHFLRGRITLAQPRRARADFARAVELEPDNAEFLAHLGYCHAELGETAGALACVDVAAALPADDRTLDLVAAIYSRFGKHREAAAALARAAEQGSRLPAIFFNLATERKFCGDFAAARTALDRAIALDPRHIKARAALSALRPATPHDNQLADYERLLAVADDPAQRLHLCHAAARECDAIGDYDRAFAFLEAGKAAMRRLAAYDFAQDQALFDAMRAGFANTQPVAGCTGARPIFVVGMPRSGTTVVDRILSGHPDVASAGETLHFGELLQELAGRRSPQLLDPRDVAPLLARADLTALGRAYVERLPQLDAARIVDKFHLNSLLAGFILRALPEARIVCVARGAMDTIVGNYRQLFDYRSGLYRYTLSLDSIAHFTVAFRRLAAFWQERFPDRFRIVSYEDLIADPESQGRALFAFCGLDWRAECLRIEDNAAPVATASAVQVRQPLNARSIGSWRRYERHLGSARAIIEQAGLDL